MSRLMRVFGFALVIGVAVALAACGSDDDSSSSGTAASTSAASTKGVVFGYSDTIGSNPNNAAQHDGARVQTKARGIKFVLTDSNLNANKQVSDVNTLIDTPGMKAIMIGILDPQAMKPVIAKAKAKGITLVTIYQPDGVADANLQPDDFEAAKAAGKYLGEKIGKGAGVAIIQGLPVVAVLKARNDGFVAGAKEAGLKILAQQVNQKDTAVGAQPIVEAWKTKFGDKLKGILAYNDPSGLGAAATVGGSFKPQIVGMNASPEGVAAVKDGRLLATYDTQPVVNGNALATMAYQIAIEKKSLPQNVYHPLPIVDSSNAADWKSYDELLKTPIDISITDVDGKPTVQAGP